jgi:hypothetical protein
MLLALSVLLATAGTAMAAFQVVRLSRTSAEPGTTVVMNVDASYMIGGTEQIELFLIAENEKQAAPEPARCDDIPSAVGVGELAWEAASVEFQANRYPGFKGVGSFTVPQVANGIYVVATIEDDPYSGCHVFGRFGVGVDVPDTAMREPPTSRYPAAGICRGPEEGPVATFVIASDVPQPRCSYVSSGQRLRIDNATDQTIHVKFNGSWHRVGAHGSRLFAPRFGEIWEPGVHRLPTDVYAGGGGPEAWLRGPFPDSATRGFPSRVPTLIGLGLLVAAAGMLIYRGVRDPLSTRSDSYIDA